MFFDVKNILFLVILYICNVNFDICSFVITGKIIELPDNVHAIIQDAHGKKYWIGHCMIFGQKNINQSFVMHLFPRKHIVAIEKVGFNFGNLPIKNAIFGEMWKKIGPETGVHFPKFCFANNDCFFTTTKFINNMTEKNIGDVFDMELIDDYKVIDMYPVFSLQQKIKKGYDRLVMYSLDADHKHGVFYNYATKKKMFCSLEKYIQEADSLGCVFDVLLYEKYLCPRIEVEHNTVLTSIQATVIDAKKNNEVIVRDDADRELLIIERQLSYGQNVGYTFLFDVFPMKTIIDIRLRNFKQPLSNGYVDARMISIINSVDSFGNLGQQFETSQGLISAVQWTNEEMSSKLLGCSFELRMIDNFYLKDIKPAIKKFARPPYQRYVLIKFSIDGKKAIFSNDHEEIAAHCDTVNLSSYRVGDSFDIHILPEYYASNVTFLSK